MKKHWYDWLVRLWIKLNRMAEESETLRVDAQVRADAPRPPTPFF